MLPELTQEELLRYSRHLMLPEVGLEGQRKLKAASVLVVGMGGLGSPISLYLAAAGIGRLGLVDHDVVDVSNLQRQVIHGSAAVGKPKTRSARKRLLDLNPRINIEVFQEVFSADNAETIASGYDLILDGTDNFPTRYLINDLCVMTRRPYIYGSVFRFEGQVSVFDSRYGACYRCIFPEPPPPGIVPSCAEGGVFGVLPGTIGTLQVTEAIKLLTGCGQPLYNTLLLYDALSMSFQRIRLKKNEHCPVCGGAPSITNLKDTVESCGLPPPDLGEAVQDTDVELTPGEVVDLQQQGRIITFVDVREPVEMQVSHLQGAINIPLYQLESRLAELNTQQTLVLFCRTGTRSKRGVQALRKVGFLNTYSLFGGINTWAQEIDPTLRQY